MYVRMYVKSFDSEFPKYVLVQKVNLYKNVMKVQTQIPTY